MIKFVLKGLMRDRSRSLFPVLTVVSGVMLTVFMYSWMNGFMSDMVQTTANFITGHVRIMSHEYRLEESQLPNDLALMGTDSLLNQLKHTYPDMIWQQRIRFGGLLDVPGKDGITRDQVPVFGLGVSLVDTASREIHILKLRDNLQTGTVPDKPGEILISSMIAENVGIETGDTVTFIGTTMHGSMSMKNFIVSGTVLFGVSGLDRSFLLADVRDVQDALDMYDSAGEIIGLFIKGIYDKERSVTMSESFNSMFSYADDSLAPEMVPLYQQNELSSIIDMAQQMSGIIAFVFIAAMSVVLWNAGLLGGLRRYGEFGVRLAIGETKKDIYRTLIMESAIIGIAGSVLGTAAGLAVSYYLEYHGLNIGSMMRNATLNINQVVRADVNFTSYYIGFIPGIFATVLGALISGINVFKRNTAQLFKEFEG